MGKNQYLGGGTKLSIYDRKKNLIKKIHQQLKSNIAQNYIALPSLEEYFSDYEEDDLKEILEDVTIDYNGRRKYWFNLVKEHNAKEDLNKKKELEDKKPQKAITVVNLSIEKIMGELYFVKYKNKNIVFEKNKLVKKSNIELLSPGFIVECHINIKNPNPMLLKAKYIHKESLCHVIYKNSVKKSIYAKISGTDLYFEYRCEDKYLKSKLNEFIKV